MPHSRGLPTPAWVSERRITQRVSTQYSENAASATPEQVAYSATARLFEKELARKCNSPLSQLLARPHDALHVTFPSEYSIAKMIVNIADVLCHYHKLPRENNLHGCLHDHYLWNEETRCVYIKEGRAVIRGLQGTYISNTQQKLVILNDRKTVTEIEVRRAIDCKDSEDSKGGSTYSN